MLLVSPWQWGLNPGPPKRNDYKADALTITPWLLNPYLLFTSHLFVRLTIFISTIWTETFLEEKGENWTQIEWSLKHKINYQLNVNTPMINKGFLSIDWFKSSRPFQMVEPSQARECSVFEWTFEAWTIWFEEIFWHFHWCSASLKKRHNIYSLSNILFPLRALLFIELSCFFLFRVTQADYHMTYLASWLKIPFKI